jgi:hypothetical protein
MVVELEYSKLVVSETFIGRDTEPVPSLFDSYKLPKVFKANRIPVILGPSTGKQELT